MKKRFAALLVSLTMAACMTACGDVSSKTDESRTEGSSQAQMGSTTSETVSDSQSSSESETETVSETTQTQDESTASGEQTSAGGDDSSSQAETAASADGKDETSKAESKADSESESSSEKVTQGTTAQQTTQATTQTVRATTRQTTAATTKATTIATTKATTKVTAKQTTKATVRVTAKQSNNSNVKPSGLTRLEDAVWELSFHGKDTNTMYLNIVRDELIKYGQAYCKSNPACFKLFTINTKLYPYYDKNGKPLYAGCDMKGNVIAVGSNVEFPYDEIDAPFNYSTSQERLQDCRSFINRMKLLIERVLCNALNHGIANMEWYITYGFEAAGTDWVVMAHIPDGEWVEF